MFQIMHEIVYEENGKDKNIKYPIRKFEDKGDAKECLLNMFGDKVGRAENKKLIILVEFDGEEIYTQEFDRDTYLYIE